MAFQDDDIKPPRPLPFDYDRKTSFTDYQTNHPAGKAARGVDLDAEFDDVEKALDETQSRLRMLQRDDGRLRNRVVTRETLDPSIALGFSPPIDWEPETFYTLTSAVFFDNALYLSLADHTSDPFDFQVDLNAGRWEIAVDFGALTVEAEAARDKARLWSEELEDTPVEPGEFSAKHHSLKSATSADNSAGSAVTAANRATDADNSADQSAASAGQSADSAAASAASADQSAESATSSATSASASADSAIASAGSAVNSAAALADFRSRYYGELTGDPALDPNGDPINAGDLYWNTATNTLRVYNGSTAAWQDSGTSTAGLYETDLSAGDDIITIPGGYTVGFILVFLNGVRLADSDYVATNGSTVVLAEAAAAGDIFSSLSFGTFDVANTYTQAQTDALFVQPVDFGGPTVEQVGKGAIVESGTNANGSYIRWENGEQVCSSRQELTRVTGAELSTDWTFPAAFVASPSALATMAELSSAFTPAKTQVTGPQGSGGASSTSQTFQLFRISGFPDFEAGDTCRVDCVAKGFWK